MINVQPTVIREADVRHLARLAQLDLSDAEVTKFSTQLTSILQYVDRVKGVEISDDVKRDFRKINVFREDDHAHEAGEDREAILAEMPQCEDNMLIVQKILSTD